MKFLHTADWHLGKLFYGTYLTEEQAWLLQNRFLPLVDEERPDVILLAGDVYDRSVPPAEAVALFDEMISEICGKRRIPFVVISGNHDSAERLSFGSALLATSGLYMCGDLARLSSIPISDAAGTVCIIPLPYAETAEVRRALSVDVHTKEEALSALAASLLETVPTGTRTIALAHDFVAGGTESDSERPLSIGGTDPVSADIFTPFCYTALGHLHGPQQAGGKDFIHYSGSLLKYSFGEAKQKKGVILGELDATGRVETKFVPLSPRHDVRVISGAFEELMGREDPAPDDFLLADLADDAPVIDAMARLRQKYPNMSALRTKAMTQEDSGMRISLHERVDMTDMLDAFSEVFRGHTLTDEEKGLFAELLQKTEEDA